MSPTFNGPTTENPESTEALPTDSCDGTATVLPKTDMLSLSIIGALTDMLRPMIALLVTDIFESMHAR